MPLLDHFHPPLSQRRHPEGFHNHLASALADMLNQRILPQNYVAEFQVHVGPRVEVDVGTFEDTAPGGNGSSSAGAATLTAAPWAPPAPLLQMPALFPENVEVQVFGLESGTRLVAAIELISAAHKERPETRRAFAAKCSAYLQQGIGLVVLDIVTHRHANLHNALIELLGTGSDYLMPQGRISVRRRLPARADAGGGAH